MLTWLDYAVLLAYLAIIAAIGLTAGRGQRSTRDYFLAGFAILLVAVAVIVWLSEGAGGERQGFGVLMLGLKVLTWIFPPLLGVFLVGVLTSRGSDAGNLLAVAVGIGLLLTVEFWRPLFGGEPPFAWTWNPLVGCAVTFAIAVAFRDRTKPRASIEARSLISTTDDSMGPAYSPRRR